VLDDAERRALLALAPLLTRSPRALKRFANTYRLLRSQVADPTLLEQSRVLLAVAASRPHPGPQDGWPADQSAGDAIAGLTPDVDWLALWRATGPDSEASPPGWWAEPAPRLAEATAVVRRLTFRQRPTG
jgi:hypothetical protein